MKIKSTVIFEKNFQSKKKILINRGGTRSSKTYSLLQLCLVWLITGQIEEGGKKFKDGILTIVRKEQTTIKATALRDREEICNDSDCGYLLTKAHYNKTDRTFKYEGRIVEFIGADDQQKLRGGKRDILYCNEANSLSYDLEFFQLFIRTTYKTIIDFNPDNEDIRINVELEQKRTFEVGDVQTIVSTYKDNPFLPATQVFEIERLGQVNMQYWKIYGLGQYGKLEGVIYQKYTIIGEVPEGAELICRGLDFGFTNDPASLTNIYKWNRSLIFEELIYEQGLTNNDLDARMQSMALDQSIPIYADSSEPKSIEELRRRRRNIKPVQKGPDSIKFGIDTVLQFNILIVSTSKNIIREIKSYCWEIDKKTGKPTNKPIDLNNHAMDGIRYGVMMKFDTRVKQVNRPLQAKR